MNIAFGNRLRAFRKHLGITQVEFAEKLKNEIIKQSHVSAWEKGSMPDGENLELIYKFFPLLNKTWLLYGKGEMLLTSPTTNKTDHEALEYKDQYIKTLEKEISDLKEKLVEAKDETIQVYKKVFQK